MKTSNEVDAKVCETCKSDIPGGCPDCTPKPEPGAEAEAKTWRISGTTMVETLDRGQDGNYVSRKDYDALQSSLDDARRERDTAHALRNQFAEENKRLFAKNREAEAENARLRALLQRADYYVSVRKTAGASDLRDDIRAALTGESK